MLFKIDSETSNFDETLSPESQAVIDENQEQAAIAEIKKKATATTYFVRVEYDGSNFSGWAKQPGMRTVEGEIKRILKKVFAYKVNLQTASRTDAGVHAYDQCFTFILPKPIEITKLKVAFNQNFSSDIKPLLIKVVDNDFNPRRDVINKEYRYYINTDELNPFENNYEYQYCKKLSKRSLKKVFKIFIGYHYFYNFSGLTKEEQKHPYRTIKKIKVMQKGKQIIIIVQGIGFLRYQIRYLIASAINYAEGKITILEIKRYLNEKHHKKYPYPKVPAGGLYLWKITYKKAIF